MKDKRHIFLSYIREDQEEVRWLREELLSAGESVWWDQDIIPGENWEMKITQALESAYAVILCFSSSSDARKTAGVFPEIYHAIDIYRQCPPDTIFILPIRLSECSIPEIKIDSIRKLSSLQYIDLFPAIQREYNLERLLESIRSAPFRPKSVDGVEAPNETEASDMARELYNLILSAPNKDAVKGMNLELLYVDDHETNCELMEYI